MGRTGRSASLRALNEAWERGITFYDTARSYGNGDAENLLAQFLKGRRDQAIVSTKFGIVPQRSSDIKRVARSIGRGIMKLSPAVQTLLLKAGSKQATAGCFSANILKSSLDKSLTELKFDYVDFLFLHEPTGDVFRDEELLSALGDVIRLGKVRFVGVSASPDVISVAMNLNMPVISAVQMPCNVLESLAIGVARNVHEREKVTVVNQPFGGVDGVRETRLRIEKVTRGGHVPAEIQKRFAVIDDALLADIVLNTVLSTSKANVILPSMMRPAHIANAVSAISNSRLTPEEMSWFADQMLLGPNAH